MPMAHAYTFRNGEPLPRGDAHMAIAARISPFVSCVMPGLFCRQREADAPPVMAEQINDVQQQENAYGVRRPSAERQRMRRVHAWPCGDVPVW